MGKRKAAEDIAPRAKSPRRDVATSSEATSKAAKTPPNQDAKEEVAIRDKESATSGAKDTTKDTTTQDAKETTTQNAKTPALLSLLQVAPWDPSAIPTARPPLPPIADAELKAAVFRHSSIAKGDQQSYEQLEFVGDAYLELISTELIDYTFGRVITPGRCAQIRELLIRNVTLAEYARSYGLEGQIQAAYDVLAGRSSTERTKVAADVFEAYVAGVVKADAANGLRTAIEWLRDLWALSIKDQLREVSAAATTGVVRTSKVLSTGRATGAKERLQTLIMVPKAVKLRYEHVREATRTKDKQQLFHMGVFLDGWGERNKLLGTGSGLSRVEATERAAEAAMANSKLMKQYESKKAVFMAMKAGGEQEED